MNKNLAIWMIFGAVLFVSVNGLEFTDCGSKIGKFSKVLVSDCDTTKSACILRRNTTANIALDFELVDTDECTEVKTVVHGIVMGMEMPFPLPNPDACKDSGLSCPLKKGTSNEYTASLPVLRAYPKVRVDVKWELRTSTDDVIICVLIPAKIE